jgi:hypothetical protein
MYMCAVHKIENDGFMRVCVLYSPRLLVRLSNACLEVETPRNSFISIVCLLRFIIRNP